MMEKKDPSSVNEKLRKERLERGWSQQYVADQLGIAVVTFNRWERGRQQPTAYYILKLSTLFGKSAEELDLIEEKEIFSSSETILGTMQQKTSITKTKHNTAAGTEQRDLDRPASLLFDIGARYTSLPERAHKVPSYLDLPKRGKILLPIVCVALLVIAALALVFLRPPFSPAPLAQANVHPNPSTVPTDLATLQKKIALDDPMTGPRDDTQWSTGNDCFFKQRTYYMTSTTGVNYCLAAGQSFSNMVYQIEMVLQQGTKAGIVFRADDQSNLYYFSINAKGGYELDLAAPGPLKVLLQGTNPAILSGYNHLNVLTVETNNAQLSFWINGSFVGQVRDTTFIRGYVGVCIGDYENPSDPTPMQATFRNMRVWLLS